MRLYNLSAWYLNLRRVAEVVQSAELDQILAAHPLLSTTSVRPQVFHAAIGSVTRALTSWLAQQRVGSIEHLVLSGQAQPGAPFVSYRHFYLRGLPAWSRYESGDTKTRPHDLPLMYSTLKECPSQVRLEIPYDPTHLLSRSAWCELIGNKRLFVFGYIASARATHIDARPYVIADIVAPQGELFNTAHNYFEIHIDSIDSFASVRQESMPRPADLKILSTIDESSVKHAFASILGEPIVPKDWGGEKSDLFTTRLQLHGSRVATALAFKGPARFSELTLSHLGKNGDQLERLFSEPADLVILQHCHRIHNSIRSIMRTYATNPSYSRRFCIIDGFDTLRILRAYRQCGQVPVPR